MRDSAARSLTSREAARIIYNTDEPTPAQLGRVEARLESGVLKGRRAAGPKARWTTTAGCVAQYLAGRAYRMEAARLADPSGGRAAGAHGIRTLPRPPGGGSSGAPAPPPGDPPQLRSTYQEILKEYFLAVIFRRRARDRTHRFRLGVALGQLGAFLVLLALGVVVLRPVFSPTPPERRAVERWIERQAGRFEVTRWYSAEPNPHGPGRVVRVEYRYFTPRGKPVETDRRFVVHKRRVDRVDSTW